MLRYISFLSIVLVLAACSEEENTPTQPIDDNFDPTGATMLKSEPLMGSGGYTVTGTVSIYEKNGEKILVLDPFSSSNGPDLRVYLSRDANANSFLNLGLLKSVTGKQSYSIPGNPSIDEFTHVLIWCQQFSVKFGGAELMN